MLLVQKELGELVERHGLDYVKSALNEILRAEKKDEASRDWDIYCRRYGFDSEHLGQIFHLGKNAYRITGLKTANRKYPILADNVANGKSYKFEAATVKLALRV